MTTCVTCGQELTPEGFCTVCDFGWEPGERPIPREPGSDISVPYDRNGRTDVSEFEKLFKKKR